MKKVGAKEVIGVIGTIIVGYGVFRRLPRNTAWKKGRVTQKTVLVSPSGFSLIANTL